MEGCATAPCGHTFSLALLHAVRGAEEQHFPLRALRTVAERANGIVRCGICGKPAPSGHVLEKQSMAPVAQLQADCAPPISDRPSAVALLDIAEDGVLVMANAVPSSLAAANHSRIEAELDAALARPLDEAAALFGEVREAVLRHDIKLDLSPSLCALMQDLVAVGSSIGGERHACTCRLQAPLSSMSLSLVAEPLAPLGASHHPASPIPFAISPGRPFPVSGVSHPLRLWLI